MMYLFAHLHITLFIFRYVEYLCHWLLRRTIIPNDILSMYFDPFEQVNMYRNFDWYSDKMHQRKIST